MMQSRRSRRTYYANQDEQKPAQAISQLQKIASLQKIINDPLCEKEQFELIDSLENEFAQKFFRQIQLYFVIMNNIKKNRRENLKGGWKISLDQVSKNIQFFIRDTPDSEIKEYLLAYYYSEFPVVNGELVLDPDDKDLESTREEGRTKLEIFHKRIAAIHEQAQRLLSYQAPSKGEIEVDYDEKGIVFLHQTIDSTKQWLTAYTAHQVPQIVGIDLKATERKLNNFDYTINKKKPGSKVGKARGEQMLSNGDIDKNTIESKEKEEVAHHHDNGDAAENHQEQEVIAIGGLSYELQVIALLQDLVDQEEYTSVCGHLIKHMQELGHPGDVIGDFFACIAEYYQLQRSVDKNEIQEKEYQDALSSVSSKMVKTLEVTLDSPDSFVKQYLRACYLSPPLRSIEELKILMDNGFPLAFPIYARNLPEHDPEGFFDCHLQGAKLLAPASQAALGGHYLDHLMFDAFEKDSAKPYPFEDSVDKEFILHGLLAAAKSGNTEAIYLIEEFLRNLFKAYKRYYKGKMDWLTDTRKIILDKMAAAAMILSGDDDKIKEMIVSCKIRKEVIEGIVPIQKGDDRIKEILQYIKDNYIAQFRMTEERAVQLGDKVYLETNTCQQMVRIGNRVEILLGRSEEIKDPKDRHFLEDTVVKVKRWENTILSHRFLYLDENDLAKREERLMSMIAGLDAIQESNNYNNNTDFIDLIKKEMVKLEESKIKLPVEGDIYKELLDAKKKILAHFVSFATDHEEKDRLKCSTRDLVLDWRFKYFEEFPKEKYPEVENPLAILAEPTPQAWVPTTFGSPPQPTPYRLFIQFVGSDLLAEEKKRGEKKEGPKIEEGSKRNERCSMM